MSTRALWPLSGFACLTLLACPAPERADDLPSQREHCTANLNYCDGDVAKQCDDRGFVESRQRCNNTSVCVDGACQANVICLAGESLCVQNVLKTCNSEGTAFASEQDCGGDICADGTCQTPSGTCPPGAAYCVSNTAYQCNADGSGLDHDPQPCDDAVCVNGLCQALICNASKADCDANTARTCNALGTGYSVTEACVDGKSCLGGRCQTLVCQPGRSCDGNLVIECNPQGTQIINQRDCAPRSCMQGVCRDIDAGSGDGSRLDARGPDTESPDSRVRDSATGDSRVADAHMRDAGRPDRGTPDRRSTDNWTADTNSPDAFRPDTFTPDTWAPDSWTPDTASGSDAATGPCQDGDSDGYGLGSGCRGWDCDDARGDVHPGATEYGDGVDNDCDGSIDEGLSCAAGAPAKSCPSQGACAANSGVSQTCQNGRWTSCPVARGEEQCNGIDDNCNGVDDDVIEAGEACSWGTGVCARTGILACNSTQKIVFCNTGTSNPAGIEACANGRDDNCDGNTDESICCPLGSSIDPSTQTCRRDLRDGLCKSCASNADCGSNYEWCISLGDRQLTCTGTGRGSCPSADYTCESWSCYYDQDCPSGGTCSGGIPGFILGTCSKKVCSYTSCGVDCRDNMPCPAGYTCYGIYLSNLDCSNQACPSNSCTNVGTSSSPDWQCAQSGEPCANGEPCAPLSCVNGRCQIGKNCLPSRAEVCSEVTADPPCAVSCGEGAHCSGNVCGANTSCSSSIRCPLGKKCVNGSCQVAERCETSNNCNAPSFFCNSGFCDNADPCTADSECPSGTYCDTGSNPSVCTTGCRLSNPSGCASDHNCNSSHRCMLSSIAPGGRCSACDDANPCTEAGTFCNPLTARCNLMCLGDNALCPQATVPASECLIFGCTNPDCP